ncbi:MAG: LPS-assembly protein LptD [Bacteroidales bacterium]|nr:LPS-assembly protein LptD [Bacteroidales bacterium]
MLISFAKSLEAQNVIGGEPGNTVPDSLKIHLAPGDSITPDTEQFLLPDSIKPGRRQSANIEPIVARRDSVERKSGSSFMLDAKVVYSASDSILLNMREQKVYMYGDVKISYKDIYLEAAYVDIDFKTNVLYAKGMPDSLGKIIGNPMFKELEQNFSSKEMTYNFDTKKGRILQVITQEAEGFLHGEVVKKMEDNSIHILDGKYTTCSLEHPHFEIRFKKAKVLPKDKIITSAAWLVIEDISTPLILPFGFFPNKKGQANGILMPSYGESASRGFFLENGGFYWGINEHVDLAIRGDIYSRGSWAIRTSSQYKRRYKYSGSLAFDYAENIEGEKGFPDYSKSSDFRVRWTHTQDPKARPNSSFSASVNAGTSKFNRYNNVSTNDYLNNTMNSSISYATTLFNGRFNLTASARHSQNNSTHAMSVSLPEVSISMTKLYPFRKKIRKGDLKWFENISLGYNSNLSNDVNTIDSLLLRKQTLKDMNNGMKHDFTINQTQKIFKFFSLSTSINIYERWYLKTYNQRWEQTGVSSTGALLGQVITDTVIGFKAAHYGNISTGINTTVYGQLNLKNGPVKAIRHVVRPSLSFSFNPDFGKKLYGYYDSYYNAASNKEVRYSHFSGTKYGGPTDGRSGALNLSINNNLEMKIKSSKDTISGEKKIKLIESFTVNSSYDFAKDSLNLSDLSISGRTRLFDKVDVTFAGAWSPYQVDSMGVTINKFIWEGSKKLLRFKSNSYGVSFSYQLKPKGKKSVAENRDILDDPNIRGTQDELQTILDNPQGFVDFSIPWNLRFSYTFRLSNVRNAQTDVNTRTITQTLNFSGDINITPKWKIGFNSGYDFDAKDLTYTSLDIYRDLHCWDLSFSWVPFGARKSYMMTLKVKATVLQDLKLTKRNNFWDY